MMIIFFSPKKKIAVGSVAHPAPLLADIERYPFWGLKRQWREVDHSFPSADEIKHRSTFQSLQNFVASTDTNMYLRDFRYSPRRI